MTGIVVFDVNETLLDTSGLDHLFRSAFGSADFRVKWFQHLKELFLVTIATGEYVDFSDLADEALEMTAEEAGFDLESKRRVELANAMNVLPPHSDVDEALSILVEGRFRLAALTNGTSGSLRNQIENAGLSKYFELLLSVDQVSRYKPAPEPYHMAADHLGASPGDVWMVAAHDWDIAGAQAAGLRTAFVARPGKVLNRRRRAKTVYAETLVEAARHIRSAEVHKPRTLRSR